MHATLTRAGVVFAALALLAAPGCGKDEAASQPSKPCADCGGEGGAAEAAGQGGDAVNLGGSLAQSHGGAGGSTPGAGTSSAGAGDGGTVAAGAFGEGGGGAGGLPGSDGEQLAICARLVNGSNAANTVQGYYTPLLLTDCRVSWLFPRGQALQNFNNQLRRFNFQFWGCPGTPRVDTFALVDGTPALSQGDVNVLIELYLKAAQAALDLTSQERLDMQAALARLSKPLIVDPSLEPSQSACATGGTGSGGSAGTGGVNASGSGGTGGVDASGSGGTGGVDASGSGGTGGAVAGAGGTL